MSNRVFLFNRFARSSAAATWLKLREGARRLAGTLVGITLVRLRLDSLRALDVTHCALNAPLGDEARGRGAAPR